MLACPFYLSKPMAYKKSPKNQIIEAKPQDLPEYGQLVSIMQGETASIITDYYRQYVGGVGVPAEPGSGIFINFDRVQRTQTYQELFAYEMYAEVERDPHISAVMESAKLNVAGMKWDVSPYLKGTEKKPSARNQAVADFVRDTLKTSSQPSQNGGIVYAFPQHIYNWMDALGKGFSASEIVWDITPDKGVRIKDIINRPQRRFQFDAVDRSLKLRTIEAPYYGIMLPPKKFIVHRCSSQWDNPFGDAKDQSLYWIWLFKRTVRKFWMQHLQVGASSIPIVKHPASANKELKAEALGIAEMIRNGAFGRIPDNFEIIWAEAKNAIQNAEAYERFDRTMDDEASKCINGQTLTAEASSNVGTGSRALGTVHQVTQTQRDIFRAEGMSSTLNATVVPWTCDYNFSNLDGYPQFRFDLEDSEDLSKESTIVKNLTDAGFDLDPEELSEKFNYTITKKAVQPLPGAIAGKPDPLEKIPADNPLSNSKVDKNGKVLEKQNANV